MKDKNNYDDHERETENLSLTSPVGELETANSTEKHPEREAPEGETSASETAGTGSPQEAEVGDGLPEETSDEANSSLTSPSVASSSIPGMFQPGCWNYFFTAIVGAVLGALIALALLWLLNSSLRLNESVEVNVLEQQSLQAAASMQAELTGVGSDLELLNGQFSALLTRESETARQLDTMQEYLDETGGELTETVKDITALQKDAAEMDERITTVSGSAEDFDAFLNGLRDLLLSMPGLDSNPSITGTEPATLISTTVTPTVAATGTPALTPSATRTPLSTRTRRPTATPFGETRPTDR